ncbi:MAG: heme-dependent oxidative N-demethylase subunit alpha family protein [Planctomycetota bacterium]
MTSQIPWTRIFPDTDHRWIMGLRQGDLGAYFADRDTTGAVRAERRRWFADEPEKYAVLLPEAEAGIRETCELARTLGAPLGPSVSDLHEQLLELGQAWEPDLVWMHPGADGVHHLVGGAVCFPSSWSLLEMLGRPMSEVHELVPGLNAALARQIETFLGKLSPGVAWQRENWGLSRDGNFNHHPSRPRSRLDATVTIDELWIRLEHQLLLKLPRSGSVLFGIRLEIVPFAEMLTDLQAAQRLGRLIATMTSTAADYKDLAAARPALLAMIAQATSAS